MTAAAWIAVGIAAAPTGAPLMLARLRLSPEQRRRAALRRRVLAAAAVVGAAVTAYAGTVADPGLAVLTTTATASVAAVVDQLLPAPTPTRPNTRSDR